MSTSLQQTPPAPHDLTAVRARQDAAIAAAARAAVTHLPAELLDALHGAWGSPEQLGLRAPEEPHLRLVAG